MLVAILAAAGRGDRLGQPKQLLDLGGKPTAAWSLELFERARVIEGIYVACEDDMRATFESVSREHAPSKVRAVVAGGATRQASVFAALSSVNPAPAFVLVHDGSRPFLTLDLLERVVAAARNCGAAIAAVPLKDTIKQAVRRADAVGRAAVDHRASAMVLQTVDRDVFWSAQTPQVFAYELLLAAHTKAIEDGFLGTDDASLVERMDAPVELVMGSYGNLKITTPEDLEVARLLANRQEAARR